MSANRSYGSINGDSGTSTSSSSSSSSSISNSNNVFDNYNDMYSFQMKVNLWINVFAVLVSDMARGILFPTLWLLVQLYNGSKTFQGVCVSLFSVGRILSSPIFGRLSELQGHRTVLIYCNLLLIIGCMIYSFAPYFRFCIPFGQFVIGVGAGSLGVTRSYVAENTAKAKKTQALASLTAFQYGGFTVTPIIGAIVSSFWHIDFSSEETDDKVKVLPYLNEYSTPSLFMVLISVVLILLLMFCFKDDHKARLAPSSSDGQSQPLLIETAKELQTNVEVRMADNSYYSESSSIDDNDKHNDTLVNKMALGFCFMNMATKGTIGVFETLVLSFSISHYDWSSYHTGMIVSVCGSLGVISLFTFDYLMKCVGHDYNLVSIGIAIMIVSCFILGKVFVEYVDENSFYTALVMMYAIGYPIGMYYHNVVFIICRQL